jgi:hypothetical protein
MKTPREILFARHKAAEPRLDTARRAALKAVSAGPTAKTGLTEAFLIFCRELFLPAQRIWTGLAACWALIFILHFASRDTSRELAKNSPPPSPEVMAVLHTQQQLFAELLANDSKLSEADQLRRSPPSPHSERRRELAIA